MMKNYFKKPRGESSDALVPARHNEGVEGLTVAPVE